MKQLLKKEILVAALLFITGTVFSQFVARHAMSPSQYQTEFNNLNAKGYRVTSLSGYTSNGKELYAAIWNKVAGPAWSARHGMSATDYQKDFNDKVSKGYRLVCLSGYAVGNQAKFAAVWDKSSGGAWKAKHNMTASDYQKAFNDYSRSGYQLQQVSGYVINGKEYFAAFWEKKSGSIIARHNLNSADYQKAFNDFTSKGYHLKCVSGYQKGRTDLYAAIWEKSAYPLAMAKHGLSRKNYQHTFDNLYYQGYVPVFVNAFASSGADNYNAIWVNKVMKYADINKMDTAVENYMSTQGVNGYSFAVTKNGRLVFAKSYGYADKAANEIMSPNHSMRIMSVSKSVTAAGIMKLLEQNKISMNQKVFGPNSILGSKYATPSDKKKLNDITISQLLHHTSGLRTCNGESEFWNKDKTYDDTMKMLLKSSDLLKFTPNTKSSYSNTGYFILAVVIQQISGQSYETFIRTNVLNPAGVGSGMYVGLANGSVKSNEAHYTPETKQNMQLWAGFGGWVARPIDLVKYLGKVDGSNTPPDIIKTSTHAILTQDTPLSPNYGCGWTISGDKQRHNGAHGGSRSWLAEIGDGYSIAIIVNNAPSNDSNLSKLLNDISTAVKGVSGFPAYDLF
ncbi:beta-lactamase family protein [Flavobacterium jejuense]|uniref:Beta-lactamase family protein n=1 Tax=Flavobacterium jejuense TaxID=1544455 RepID=A0ABX0IRA3_9FLAO|nr:serine hydrolase [Flavobacterium jejuense]NHN24656.1 beta-lactamase family protein [Flavobacterium jejuense]